MKIADVPQAAFTQKATEVPMKMVFVYDWAALYELVEKKGYVVLECDESELRITNTGGEEAPVVKAFNSWARANFGHQIKTKRIGATRWFVAL